jgi:hypothetical protein
MDLNPRSLSLAGYVPTVEITMVYMVLFSLVMHHELCIPNPKSNISPIDTIKINRRVLHKIVLYIPCVYSRSYDAYLGGFGVEI